MDLLKASLYKLDINTADIKSKDIQDVLLAVKKADVNSDHLDEYFETILEKLWKHLMIELKEFDDQLLCSTCFYIVLDKSKNQGVYLNKVLEIIQNELQVKNKSRISLAISLCYGLFQSTYLIQKPNNLSVISERVFLEIFCLLIHKAYEYSQYTFIVFKIMTSFKKVVGTEFQKILFNSENQIKLLNVINHNWENPVTGIRNLNRIVFQNLLHVLDKNIYETIIYEINNFYWNKAKFLMLAEIIEYHTGEIDHLVSKNQWVDGLVYSLSKPGLVSAGTDMYNAILKKNKSEEQWTVIFMVKVMDILVGNCFKTIENFINYWCLNTFKKFPSLLQLFINECNNINHTEHTLYSVISLMKQGSKLGLRKSLSTNYILKNEEQLFSLCLEHSNISVRMLAFEIICISQQSFFKSEKEYEQILKYLTDNVNSDCTVLRISMLNNLTIFLDKLNVLYLNKTNIDDDTTLQSLVLFCQNLQNFIIKSINLDGNYQRKITSVKIAQVVMKSFYEIKPRKKQQIREKNTSIIGYLRKNSYWKLHGNDFIMKLVGLLKDPAKDVHEAVLILLSEFYTTELSDTFLINYLIDEGLKCIASKFFYEISSGLVMFKLIINIILRNKNIECMFKCVEDIFHFAFNEVTQEHSSKRDIVKSIEDGKQLHSFLNIFSIIFETTLKGLSEINIQKDAILSLLIIVDGISNQFVWEEDLSKCSDFSKMSDMVQTLIEKSSLEFESDDDQTKISDLHQIVLNCLWLNVKASCELASLLIQYFKYDKDICEKCLNIITHVLETSRHKGAIEAAGTALGVGIHCLSSLEDDLDVSKLPLNLLKDKLNEFLFETAMSSVTRRGAGLSIMVHRIVSNDLKKGRPLFHYFMKTLLNMCDSLDDTEKSGMSAEIGNEKDLPKAILIHFLTRIVTDSCLASDTMYYTAELAALAFTNLINNHWQIRNAALQLYGALIPKLIGQKKASGLDEKTVATVACDEFRSHSPKLWKYIVQQIKEDNHQDIIQAHSNLVPILNVLASLAKRYNFSYDLKYQKKDDSNLLLHLLPLLGSPIYTVRRLTSQSIPNMFTVDHLTEILENIEIISENYLHGILMLISSYHINDNQNASENFKILCNKYQNLLKQNNPSYISRWTIAKVCNESENITIEMIENVIIELNSNKYRPGVFLWANSKIQNFLEKIPMNLFPKALSLALQTQEIELYCNTFNKRIEGNTEVSKDNLLEAAQILLQSEMITKSSALWELLYNISLKIDITIEINELNTISEYIKQPLYKLRYMIPFATRVQVKQINNECLLLLSKSIYLLCNPECNDVDMRYIAALANNEFGNDLKGFSDDVKINAIKSAVLLLQDEDEDIRHLSVIFHKNSTDVPKHPFICLNEILKFEFLNKILNIPRKSIQRICDDLISLIYPVSVNKNNEYNPFSNDSKNIYLEKVLFKQTLQDLKNVCS